MLDREERRTPKGAWLGMALCAGLAWLGPARAEASWPERPVKLIVAVAAGGPTDDLARTLANGLGEALGGSFFVENRGGGGGRIGIGAAARAEPDGYTLLVAASSLTISVAMSAATPYDPEKDFEPIAMIATTPTAFSVLSSLGVKDLKSLIEYSRRGTDPLNYATPGTGTVGHLAAELLKIRTGLRMAHVPHTGAGPALQSLLSGAVQVLATPVPAVQAHADTGTITVLAVTSEARWKQLPNIPTMVELGYDGFVADTFFGLLAPAGTPSTVTRMLTSATIDVLRKPETAGRLARIGYDVVAKGPEELEKRISNELSLWRDVARQAGLVVK